MSLNLSMLGGSIFSRHPTGPPWVPCMEYLCDCGFLCCVRDGGRSVSHSSKYSGHQSMCYNNVCRVVWVSPAVPSAKN